MLTFIEKKKNHHHRGIKWLITARPTFLNLNLNVNSMRHQPMTAKRRFHDNNENNVINEYLEIFSFSFTPPIEDMKFLIVKQCVISSIASPGNAKLGIRMTTLHEQTLTEEIEESCSDPDDEYDRVAYKPPIRSKFPMSKTMGSLRDIGNNSFISNTPITNSTSNGMTTNDAIKAGTPSMTSSTSSGYDSQAVSSTNLTNDDSFSIQSINVDDTLGTII